MPQISCKDLVLSYERRVVINGLSFDVNEGDYLCIVGENGSGKSTLAKALLGLKSPSAGSIVRDDALRRSGIGYLPQQTELRRDFPASVGEVIISGRVAALGRRPFYGRADVKAARAGCGRSWGYSRCSAGRSPRFPAASGSACCLLVRFARAAE